MHSAFNSRYAHDHWCNMSIDIIGLIIGLIIGDGIGVPFNRYVNSPPRVSPRGTRSPATSTDGLRLPVMRRRGGSCTGVESSTTILDNFKVIVCNQPQV